MGLVARPDRDILRQPRRLSNSRVASEARINTPPRRDQSWPRQFRLSIKLANSLMRHGRAACGRQERPAPRKPELILPIHQARLLAGSNLTWKKSRPLACCEGAANTCIRKLKTRMSTGRRPRIPVDSSGRCSTSTVPALAAGPRRRRPRPWPRRRSQRRPQSRRRRPSDTSSAAPSRHSLRDRPPRRDRRRRHGSQAASVGAASAGAAADSRQRLFRRDGRRRRVAPQRSRRDARQRLSRSTRRSTAPTDWNPAIRWRRLADALKPKSCDRHAGAFDQTRPNHGFPPCAAQSLARTYRTNQRRVERPRTGRRLKLLTQPVRQARTNAWRLARFRDPGRQKANAETRPPLAARRWSRAAMSSISVEAEPLLRRGPRSAAPPHRPARASADCSRARLECGDAIHRASGRTPVYR